MSRVIPGFDYRTQKPAQRTRAEWREDLRAVIKAGGQRRAENGETFAHGKDGLIVFEVYAILPA